MRLLGNVVHCGSYLLVKGVMLLNFVFFGLMCSTVVANVQNRYNYSDNSVAFLGFGCWVVSLSKLGYGLIGSCWDTNILINFGEC